jgi:thioredoxin-dependent peroxiredoxin
MQIMETRVPAVKFIFRENGEFVTRSAIDLFSGKRVVIFSLPGAFTPTCSAYQLPGYEEKYDEFTSLGIDAIYCISVNDAFVMNAWAKDLVIEKVKMIPDGNADFTREMGMLVSKGNLGFGNRSWRYAAVIDDGVVEWMTVEPGQKSEATEDPYGMTTPEEMLKYLQRYSEKRTVNF